MQSINNEVGKVMFVFVLRTVQCHFTLRKDIDDARI